MTAVRRTDAHSRHVDAHTRLEEPQVGQMCSACGQSLGHWARDTLTGLPDRGGWDRQAPATFARARHEANAVALLMVDIDCFTLVNDEYGHLAGDTVLKAVAAAVWGRSRPGDVVCGYGGDEFLVLLPSVSRDEALVAVHQAWCQSDLTDRFLDADFALRHAKRRGRDLVDLCTGVACGCPNPEF